MIVKIGFVVNEVSSELAAYTTTHLALAALKRGHDVCYIEIEDFSYGTDQKVHALAREVNLQKNESDRELLLTLQSHDLHEERICVDDLDILFLRNDPARDFVTRPWARLAGINFGRLASRRGVIVLNDPDGLNHAINKIYTEYLPNSVTPLSIITRDRSEIKAFVKEQNGPCILKPLIGSGGHNVFLLKPDEALNVNQMIDSVLTDGYAITQEYLPAADKGDLRVFILNGDILHVDDKPAIINRRRPQDDVRANLTVGGTAHRSDLSDSIQTVVDEIRPFILEDGLFFVGADIIGDRLIELNVFSPGGLVGASRLWDVDFHSEVVAALERKVALKSKSPLSNRELAALDG